MGSARIGAAVAVVALVAGCTSTPDGPDAQTSGVAAPASQATSKDPDRTGPDALWSRDAPAGDPWVGVFGDVVVLTGEGQIVGVERSSGTQRWARPRPSGLHVADNLIVLAQAPGPVEAIDPSTGATVWKIDVPDRNLQVYKRSIYTDNCENRAGNAPGACRITAYDVRDGRVRWTTPASIGGVGLHRIGPNRPYAPDAGPYLVAGIGASGKRYGALDEKTGQPLPGRAAGAGWTMFAIGTLLVTSNNDPPAGDQRCSVRMAAVDARTGATAWTGAVFSGRAKDDSCVKSLAGREVQDVIGAGSRIAAVTETGTPQVFDLATGRTVWAGDAPGVPIGSDGSSLLVRSQADSGGIAVLDFATGKKRWSAADPGLEGSSASWRSAVTSGLVAVSCGYGQGRPCVVVHDAASGKQLGRFPGWLAGAGADWVAVTHGGGGTPLRLDFIAF